MEQWCSSCDEELASLEGESTSSSGSDGGGGGGGSAEAQQRQERRRQRQAGREAGERGSKVEGEGEKLEPDYFI